MTGKCGMRNRSAIARAIESKIPPTPIRCFVLIEPKSALRDVMMLPSSCGNGMINLKVAPVCDLSLYSLVQLVSFMASIRALKP